MNKHSPLKMLAAAALIGAASQSVRSDEAAPGVTATPAGQTATPGSGHVPGWYPPGPEPRGYAQPWSQPSQMPSPPVVGYLHSYYLPYGQYQTGTGISGRDSLSIQLKQAQELLAEKTTELEASKKQVVAQTTELETARKQIARLQNELQTATAALQKAQDDTLNAGRQVDATTAQVDTLKHVLCELAARLEARNSALQSVLQKSAAEPDIPDSTAAGDVEADAAADSELPADRKCSQLSQYPAITSSQRGVTITTQKR